MAERVSVKEKYSGAQTMLKTANLYACHFFTLLSIAEEENIRQKRKNPGVDFLEAVFIAKKNKWMDEEFTVTVKGSLDLLKYYTGKTWTRSEVKTLPKVIKDNQYTEVVHKNDRTGYTHYHRRSFDTLVSSITVAEGYIEKYYIYTVED